MNIFYYKSVNFDDNFLCPCRLSPGACAILLVPAHVTNMPVLYVPSEGVFR